MKTAKADLTRIPRLGNRRPFWFHEAGMKVRIRAFDPGRKILVLGANMATLVILPAEMVQPCVVGWILDREIVQFPSGNEKDEGRRYFSDKELAASFGLTDDFGGYTFMTHHYTADSAVCGQYVREGKFLNIPGPGTGFHGDPNLSLYVGDEIKEAVRELLGLQPD